MQPCPSCKTQIPTNATMCFACGTRLSAAPAPKKAEEPTEQPLVGAKTTFGMMSPVAKSAKSAAPVLSTPPAKPTAPTSNASPAKSAWSMPKSQSKSQPLQAPADEPGLEAVPPKTMFGVGMAVQPVIKSAPTASPPAPVSEPEPVPVPPKTVFGVGVVAPAAPSAPFEMPSVAPAAYIEPAVRLSPPASVVPAALAETMQAPESPPLAKPAVALVNNTNLVSPQEREVLGADSSLPRTPPALAEDGSLQMPSAPSSPAQVLFYFLKVLGARVDFLREARRLEAELLQWQERVNYLLATIGLRAQHTPLPEVAQQQAQVSTLAGRVSGLVVQQQSTMGEKGQRLKAFEEREVELNREIVEKESAYTSLNSQLKEIEAARREIQNKLKQQPQSIEAANDLANTNNPYNDLKIQTESAKKLLQEARAKFTATTQEKKQMLKDVETQMKALRDELKKVLTSIGQAALLQSAEAAQSCKAEIEAVNIGIAARQNAAQQYRAQLTMVDKQKFLQGAGAFAGVFVVLMVVLFLFRP
jgi:hypothetical protein